jgi:hypothetical protein
MIKRPKLHKKKKLKIKSLQKNKNNKVISKFSIILKKAKKYSTGIMPSSDSNSQDIHLFKF